MGHHGCEQVICGTTENPVGNRVGQEQAAHILSMFLSPPDLASLWLEHYNFSFTPSLHGALHGRRRPEEAAFQCQNQAAQDGQSW